MALYVSPGFSRAADAHLRLALMFKARRYWGAAAAHFRRAKLSPHQDATFTRLELSFHAAHLLEARGLRKAARDAYAKLLNEPQLALTLKADVCRQLGKSGFFYCNPFLCTSVSIVPKLSETYNPCVSPLTYACFQISRLFNSTAFQRWTMFSLLRYGTLLTNIYVTSIKQNCLTLNVTQPAIKESETMRHPIHYSG